MISRKYIRFLLIGFFGLIVAIASAQDSSSTPRIIKLDIPEELLSRLPGEQLAQFIQCRERVLMNRLGNTHFQDIYEEIGVSKNAISRIPDDQLFQFLMDRKFIELDADEHIRFDTSQGRHQSSSGPSPKDVITILYLLIGIALFIAVLNMVLGHLRKRGEQEIVINALQQGVDIPYEMIKGSRQRSFIRNAIIFIALGIGILASGMYDVLPSALGIIPISIGVGLVVASQIFND